jgi:hypothetical protein
MKIVINNCFGGFGLSRSALIKLRDMGIDTYDNWASLENRSDKNKPWILLNDKDYYSNFEDHRSNEKLLSVVLDLGDDASGPLADLNIVEIPDGIEYYIHDYDGVETIHEQHNSWS